jgi:integrase
VKLSAPTSTLWALSVGTGPWWSHARAAKSSPSRSRRAPPGVIDLAISERSEGPVFLAPNGHRLDRHGAGRIVRRVARRAGITKPAGPHTLRHAFITAALDAGVSLRDVQEAASHADPGPR